MKVQFPIKLILLLLASNSYANSDGVKYFDEHKRLSHLSAWELISSICGANLGMYSTKQEIICDEGECKGEMKYSKSSYNEEIILDGNFNLMFSTQHEFDSQIIKEKSANNQEKNTSLNIVVEESGLSSENVENLSSCIKKMGEILAEKSIGPELKALLSEEYDYKKLEPDYKTETFTLNELDYSIVTVQYPANITAGDIVPVQIVVTPSLRFTL